MRKGFSICTILILASLSLAAQGHRPPSGSVPGSDHSIAPSGPAAGADRDTGKERAEEVGEGKKEGLEGDQGKKKGHKKHHKEQAKKGWSWPGHQEWWFTARWLVESSSPVALPSWVRQRR